MPEGKWIPVFSVRVMFYWKGAPMDIKPTEDFQNRGAAEYFRDQMLEILGTHRDVEHAAAAIQEGYVHLSN
jgi:hypothetical protein